MSTTSSPTNILHQPFPINTATNTEERPEWPEETTTTSNQCMLTSIYNKWTYSYMNRILKKGSEQKCLDNSSHLSQNDLYQVPSSIEISFLHQKFKSIYNEQQQKQHHRQLLKTLWCIAAPTFIPAGICQFVSVLAQVSVPLLVRQILLVLESNPSQSVLREGIPFVILFFAANVTNAFCNHMHHHLAFQSGITIRAAIVDVIYKKTLYLTPRGRMGLTTGEITNLVAIDAQKLFEVMQEAHLIWSCPLAMVIMTILLILIMGPISIVGVVVLVFVAPVVKTIASKMIAIRQKRIKVSDGRIEMVSAMLQGMKITKLYNYESRFKEGITEIRNQEVKLLWKEMQVWAWSLVVMDATLILASAATFATYVLVDENGILTASKTFTVLLLFTALRFPINYAGKLLGKAAQGYQAAQRIKSFLCREERKYGNDMDKSIGCSETGRESNESNECCKISEDGKPEQQLGEDPLLVVKNGHFFVGSSLPPTSDTDEPLHSNNSSFSLSNINLTLQPSQILAVVGQVGSGKSSLINGLIGEISSSPETQVTTYGTIGYASQVPFILNMTLRENILFGLPFEKERYEQVLDACCLWQDIEQLGVNSDLTEIGERGVTLSGGQKQRVSLARVAYSQPSIAIFDDPLSSLDADTSRQVFEKLFKSSHLLRHSAIVLVTHASHFLQQMDQILILCKGHVAFLGSWMNLLEFESDNPQTRRLIESMRNAVQEEGKNDDSEKKELEGEKQRLSFRDGDALTYDGASTERLMTYEEREHGLSKFNTWLIWFQNAGGCTFLLLLALFLVIYKVTYVGTEWWLAFWTQAHDQPNELFGKTFPPQTDGLSTQFQYLKVYAIILLCSFVAVIIRSYIVVSGGVRCAEHLFSQMTMCVLRAPMEYFETTPLGRILNRFTFDVEALDVTMTQAMSFMLIGCSWFVAGVIVMVAILPWLILAIVPITLLYGMLQLHYRKSAADLQRLDVVARSPLQASLAEGLDGATTIRVFHRFDFFIRKFQSQLNENSSAMLNFISAHRWLAVRIELLGSLIALVACVLVVAFNDVLKLNSSLVALLIIWASEFTITLGFMVDNFSESEAAITSVERIHAMSELPQESNMTTSESNKVDSSWPSRGMLEFDNVHLRYRKGLPLALNGLSFKIEAGKRCGIVGRTGAGKSTLTAALFRLVEIETGRILLDGIDLSTLGLSDVRGRSNGMSIIPQDPVLFSGTLRECLDLYGLSTDDTILEALASVQISSASKEMKALDDVVEEHGANFSVGERQLLCLARAILNKPKLLVLDEATASVDGETDAFIQNMLRTRFEGTTLLTIAHRLNTIMDYDVVLVLDKGRAVEFGSPLELLERDDGVFTELVNYTGEESAAALKGIAEAAARER